MMSVGARGFMQKVDRCKECGGDGKREALGSMEVPGVCTHCAGSGRQSFIRNTTLTNEDIQWAIDKRLGKLADEWHEKRQKL